MRYAKHFIPLESNPGIFSDLAHRLGLSSDLVFHDVLSLDDSGVLAFIPRPAVALVLVFPTSPAYESHVAEQDRDRDAYSQRGDEEHVIWYRQTINNACGLYAILHAVSNGSSRNSIRSGSFLEGLLMSVDNQSQAGRAKVLEESVDLEEAYREVALQGDTDPPENAEAEVDFHYVCFVKSHRDGHLYALDGDREGGPVDWGLFSGEDVLSQDGLAVIKEFVKPVERSVGFSLLALAPQ